MASSTAHEPTSSSSQTSPDATFSNPTQTPDSATSSEPPLHPQSCVLCAHRKVKCDRRDPTCANCVKAKVTCEYRAPLPRGPRKRKHLVDIEDSPAVVAEKLAKCEELLRSLGISPENVTEGRAYTAPSHKAHAENESGLAIPRGRLMAENGRLRYIENTLWTTVADEIPEHESSMTDQQREIEVSRSGRRFYSNSIGSMMLGLPFLSGRTEPIPLDIPREYARVFWNYFIDNVYPLTKFVHAPTEERHHTVYLNRPQDLPKRIQAMLAGIYFSGLNSMNEEQCQHHFQRSWRDLIKTFFPITANALVEARFLGTIDVETLQGLVYFVICCRDKIDARTVWTLVGVAIRIGQYIGLHYDGEELNLSPFQTEIRRRLWWQIGILEASLGELSGFGPSTLVTSSGTKQPMNLNDSDLRPEMTKLPPPRIGATDMMFVMLRTTGGMFARKNKIGSLFMGSWVKQSSGNQNATKMLQKLIGEIEELLEREFLRYCDVINPLHKLCSSMTRVFLCRLRLKMYHPKRRKWAEAELNTQERDFCFENARKILEYDNFILTDKTLEKFRWHVITHFQFDALLFLLHDLQTRDVFEAKSKEAWDVIEQCFSNHIEMMLDLTKLLNIAVGIMCLKAWDIKEKAHLERDPSDPIQQSAPAFITSLRQREADRHAARQQSSTQGRGAGDAPNIQPPPPKQYGLYEHAAMPLSLNEGTGINSALDAMVDLDFSFGVSEDFNFTFEMPQDLSLGTAAQPATNVMPGATNFDVWDNLFNWGQPGGGMQS